jgi:sulfatase modifying factor 1
MKKFIFLFLIILFSCKDNKTYLTSVSYAQFEEFVNETKYITDAERYGWSIVQIDVANYRTGTNANWKKPNGVDTVSSNDLPVTQVSYNDAKAYCNWAN